MDARLMNTQKTEVFEEIKSNGIDPMMFQWAEGTHNANSISILKLVDHGFYFEFGYGERNWQSPYRGRYVPGQLTREESYTLGEWSRMVSRVGAWVNNVRRELSTPDPWKSLPGFTDVTQLRVAPQVANTQFSFAE